MKKKYAYANIKIPVELKANGIIEPMKEYVQIEFSICNELPEKNVNNLNVMNNLHSLFHNIPNFENRPTNKIPISKSINDEIEHPLFNIRDHEEKDEENIIKSKNIQPSQTLSEKHDSQQYQTTYQTTDQTTYQTSEETSEETSEFIPTEVPISLIKQYKKREGASGGTVGSPESFKNKKRNKFNITAKMRE